MTSQNNELGKRERIIIDRLWQIRKAAMDILNLVNTNHRNKIGEEWEDCDGECDRCILHNFDESIHCSIIPDVAKMNIPEAHQRGRS